VAKKSYKVCLRWMRITGQRSRVEETTRIPLEDLYPLIPGMPQHCSAYINTAGHAMCNYKIEVLQAYQDFSVTRIEKKSRLYYGRIV
jgi:hypothetical protein